jgi:homoserine/homoserine lactone efflux protein
VSAIVDPQLFLAYLGVTALFVITPGPAMLFAIATGVSHGRRGVVLAAIGMNLGTLVWFAGGALGLAAVAKAAPVVLDVLRWVGVAYLVWLGGGKLRAAIRDKVGEGEAIKASGRPFRDGLVVQLSNPKALLFVTAVLPPFIAPDLAPAPQIALFGLSAVALDALSMIAYGFGGAALAMRLRRPRERRIFAAVTGVLLLAAAVLILTRR